MWASFAKDGIPILTIATLRGSCSSTLTTRHQNKQTHHRMNHHGQYDSGDSQGRVAFVVAIVVVQRMRQKDASRISHRINAAPKSRHGDTHQNETLVYNVVQSRHCRPWKKESAPHDGSDPIKPTFYIFQPPSRRGSDESEKNPTMTSAAGRRQPAELCVCVCVSGQFKFLNDDMIHDENGLVCACPEPKESLQMVM